MSRDWSKAKPNKYATGTRPVTIRMDVNLIHWLMAESKRRDLRGYQTLANQLLMDAMNKSSESSAQPIIGGELRNDILATLQALMMRVSESENENDDFVVEVKDFEVKAPNPKRPKEKLAR